MDDDQGRAHRGLHNVDLVVGLDRTTTARTLDVSTHEAFPSCSTGLPVDEGARLYALHATVTSRPVVPAGMSRLSFTVVVVVPPWWSVAHVCWWRDTAPITRGAEGVRVVRVGGAPVVTVTKLRFLGSRVRRTARCSPNDVAWRERDVRASVCRQPSRRCRSGMPWPGENVTPERRFLANGASIDRDRAPARRTRPRQDLSVTVTQRSPGGTGGSDRLGADLART